MAIPKILLKLRQLSTLHSYKRYRQGIVACTWLCCVPVAVMSGASIRVWLFPLIKTLIQHGLPLSILSVCLHSLPTPTLLDHGPGEKHCGSKAPYLDTTWISYKSCNLWKEFLILFLMVAREKEMECQIHLISNHGESSTTSKFKSVKQQGLCTAQIEMSRQFWPAGLTI